MAVMIIFCYSPPPQHTYGQLYNSQSFTVNNTGPYHDILIIIKARVRSLEFLNILRSKFRFKPAKSPILG